MSVYDCSTLLVTRPLDSVLIYWGLAITFLNSATSFPPFIVTEIRVEHDVPPT